MLVDCFQGERSRPSKKSVYFFAIGYPISGYKTSPFKMTINLKVYPFALIQTVRYVRS